MFLRNGKSAQLWIETLAGLWLGMRPGDGNAEKPTAESRDGLAKEGYAFGSFFLLACEGLLALADAQ